ncbi:MAG: MmcQ/YjbR family DNA-binding protein [Myxococcaceae bacterium]|nr:MmcQ/YjbR family DNA-binding protein [Myxococcaceae bacterium]
MARTRRHAHFPVLEALRRFGLALPGAHTKAPWPGHLDLAVKDKTFAYLSLEHEPLRVGVKLPRSAALALTMPNVQPTAYGLGKSGWVTATFADADRPPVGLLTAWLDESYRAQAPKTLVKQLDAGRAPPKPSRRPAARKAR